MTLSQQSPPDASGSRRGRRLIVAAAVVAILGIVALVALVWYIFFRPAGPPPLAPGAPLIPEGWLSGPAVLALAAAVLA